MARIAASDKWLASRKSHQKARAKLKLAGRCVWRCGRKAAKGRVLCRTCNAKKRAADAARRAA